MAAPTPEEGTFARQVLARAAGRRVGRITTRRGDLIAQLIPLVVLVVIGTIYTFLTPAFLTQDNIFNVLRQVSIIGFMAIGETFVVLIAGIDLSVASLLAFSGMTASLVEVAHHNVALSVATGLGVGIGSGLIQGLVTAKGRVPSFIVTLGGFEAFRGLALIANGGQPVSGFGDAYTTIGQGLVGPVPVPVIIFGVFVLASELVLRRTVFGRNVYALGGNPEAARLAGINTARVTIGVFVIAGFFAGLSGVVLTSRLAAGDPNAAAGTELLDVIASVVIGGTSLFGGVGSIIGTLIGAILIGVVTNGLLLLNVSPFTQQVVIGLIIVAAVFVDQFVKARSR